MHPDQEIEQVLQRCGEKDIARIVVSKQYIPGSDATWVSIFVRLETHTYPVSSGLHKNFEEALDVVQPKVEGERNWYNQTRKGREAGR